MKNKKTMLREFLGSGKADIEIKLFLPEFSGETTIELSGEQNTPFKYRGRTFSVRDTRAAFHILTLYGSIGKTGNVQLRSSNSFDSLKDNSGLNFLIGSRTNKATLWAADQKARGRFFHFDFGKQWGIHCVGGKYFSIPNPANIDDETYATSTDYGVICRLSGTVSNAPLLSNSADSIGSYFIVAGLGNRATEGCGYYLARNWEEIYKKYGTDEFTLILEFPPPINPEISHPLLWIPQR
jgi:hypothetical protein